MLVVPAMLCFGFSRRPLRFGLGIGAVLLAGTLYTGEQGRPVATRRSFFGVNRVTLDATRGLHLLIHGSTLHGVQSIAAGQRRVPLGYYARSGPVAAGVGALARAAGVAARIQFDGDVTPAERARGKLASRWAVMTRGPAELGSLAADARWTPPRASADGRVWTDDFSSVLGVLRWR